MSAFVTQREGSGMTTPLILAGITAVGLLFYLVAVLIRPERF
jgi:K+-transporting ATPase KdpF subunit